MIALALLFIVIISLLWLVMRLLKNFFEAYSNVYISESNQTAELQNNLNLQKNEMEILETEKQINALIDERLVQMEEKFPTGQTQEELSEQAPEILAITLKNMLHSSLTLMKNETLGTKN